MCVMVLWILNFRCARGSWVLQHHRINKAGQRENQRERCQTKSGDKDIRDV